MVTEDVFATKCAKQNTKVINMVKAVNKYMDENTGKLYDTPADAIEAENGSTAATTETEMQIQIGSLLWTSGEMEVSTFEDEGVADGRIGLLVIAADGSEFQVVITKNGAY